MYTLPSKLKLFSIIIMVLGLAGITYGFLTAPKTIEDVKENLNFEFKKQHQGIDNLRKYFEENPEVGKYLFKKFIQVLKKS